MANEFTLDKLTSQLTELPNIIGRLGISIATAQKALNADYVTSLQQTMQIVNATMQPVAASLNEAIGKAKTAGTQAQAAYDNAAGGADEAKKASTLAALTKAKADLEALQKQDPNALVLMLIKALAPSRYQFSETTLDFSADLSQTQNVGGSLSLGVGFSAVTVNAAFSLAYGYDYKAAARIKTVLHALPADAAFLPALLERAKDMDVSQLKLAPKDADYNKLMIEGLKQIAATPIPAKTS